MSLDLNFPPQLMLHVGLLQLRLEQHFEGNDVLARLLSCQVNVAELPPPKWTANLKVIKGPFPLAFLPAKMVGFIVVQKNRSGVLKKNIQIRVGVVG